MATTMDSDVIATNQLKECWITSLILLDKMFSIDSSSVVIIQSKLKSEVALYDFCDVNPSTMIGQARLVGRNVMEKDLQTTVDLLSMNIIKNTPVIEKVTNPAVVQAAPPIVTKTVVPAQPAVVQAAPPMVTKTVVPAQPAVVQAAPQNITKTVVPAQAAVVQAAPQIVSKTVVPAQPAVVQAAPQNITKTVVPARPAVVQAAPWIVVKPILVPAQAAVVQAAPPMVTKTGVPAKRVILRSLLKDVTAALVRPAIGQSILKIVPWPPTKEPRPPPAIMNPVQSFLYITDGSSSDGKLLPVRPCLVKDQSFDNEEDCSPLPTYDKMPRQQQAKNKTIDGKSGVKTTIALEMDRVAGSHSGLARDSGPGNAAMATQNGMRNIAVATRTGGRVGTLVTMNITNTTNKALIKTFLCEHCGKRFNNRNYRNKHRRTHNVKKFLCGYCGKAFHTARRLRMHESIHTGVKEFQCEYCSKGFNLRYVLNRHIQIHHTNTSASYSCEVCLKSYKKKSVLAEHKQQVHSPNSERRHKCQYCDKAFWTSTKLRFHTRTHTKEKPHTCEHCSRPFATLSQLKTHLKLVHNEPGEKPVPQFKCSQCDKCYLTRQFLEDHLNVHTGATPYGCRECEQKFATPSARRYHEDKHRQARVSSGELGAPAMDEQAGESSSKRAAPAMDSQSAGPKKKRQAGPFICLLCEDTLVFLSHWTLLNHELQHKVDGKFQCIHCEDVFIEKDLLLEHMQAAHGNIINLKCGHCHLRFTTLAKLKYHEYQKHIKVTKEMDGYQCSVCGKILRSRQACVDHENGHTGVTPYSCPHPGCQAAFSTRSRCQKHHRQHKQENKCEICEKECEGQAKLKDHMNTHTGATPYRCRHCPKEFSTRKSWLTHEKKHAMSTSKPKPTQAYHCIVCNKSFRQKCFYSDHLNLHTGATPYACPHCQQAFATKYRLHNHSLSCKMDTEKLVFQCSFCERTFYSRRSCDDHINTHTGDRPYKCRHVNCELAFHTYSTRKQHERRHVLRDGTGHRDV